MMKKVKEFNTHFKEKIDEYDELLTGNIIFQNRMKGVGVLSKEDAISYGCTGPTARASGVSCDIRKLFPYEVYDKVDFKECMATEGDSFARYVVRLEEMKESIEFSKDIILSSEIMSLLVVEQSFISQLLFVFIINNVGMFLYLISIFTYQTLIFT